MNQNSEMIVLEETALRIVPTLGDRSDSDENGATV